MGMQICGAPKLTGDLSMRPASVMMLALAVTGLYVLSACGPAQYALVASTPSATSAVSKHKTATCQVRACLIVLDPATDTDGDGVTDVDEEKFGTDPNDAASQPPALDLVRLVLPRQLPSFERHFTELVVLPTLTPDGKALATGLGEFKLHDHDATLLNTLFDITSTFNRNGFADLLALRASVIKNSDSDSFHQAVTNHEDKVSWAADGWTDIAKTAPYLMGGNNGAVTGITDSKMSYGQGMLTLDYKVNYSSGGYDKVTQTDDVDVNSGVSKKSSTVDSYDSNGKLIKSMLIERTERTNEDGNETSTTIITEKFYNKDGELTSQTVTRTTTTTYSDGSSATHIRTDTYNGKGEHMGTVEVDKSTCNPAKANCEGGVTVDKYVDPDYIEMAVNSPEAMAALEFRIKWVSQPVPDNGDATAGPPGSGAEWQPGNLIVDFPLVALFDPVEAVSVFASEEPKFKGVLPDYDPRLAELYGLTGVTQPTRNDDGDATWPT
jgi:hypothetical protein